MHMKIFQWFVSINMQIRFLEVELYEIYSVILYRQYSGLKCLSVLLIIGCVIVDGYLAHYYANKW